MALNNSELKDIDPTFGSSLDEQSEHSWWWSPEPVHLAPAPMQRRAPTRFDVITASFEFPDALVDARAQALVEDARRGGVRHSLSLWRAALRQSLEQIARETAHTPNEAVCAALFWDRVGASYRVAVTFEVARGAGTGHARH